MRKKAIHQFSDTAIAGDAITDQILLIRNWLRELGFRSDIYTEYCHAEMEKEVLPASTYHRQSNEDVLVYHHAIGANVADRLLKLDIPLILIYHNITPPDFFTLIDPALMFHLVSGRRQLRALQSQTLLALGDSVYNEIELKEVGYKNTNVLPIVLDPTKYDLAPDPEIFARFDDGQPNLLFLGRLSPHKKQEDLIKLLHYYKRIEPDARLFLVGSGYLENYVKWLQRHNNWTRVPGGNDRILQSCWLVYLYE